MTTSDPTLRLGLIAVYDGDGVAVGSSSDESASPVLLLPRSDPAVALFLDAIEGLPVAWADYLPDLALAEPGASGASPTR